MPDTADPPARRITLEQAYVAREHASSQYREWRNLGDLLSTPERFGVDSWVVGTIDEVSKGVGAVPVTEEEAKSLGVDHRVVGFDDQGVQWQTLTLTVRVDETFTQSERLRATAGETIKVGLVTYPEIGFEQARATLLSYGRVALPLQDTNLVFRHDESVHPIFDDGAMLVRVAADGRLSLPLKVADEATAALAGITTLDGARRRVAT